MLCVRLLLRSNRDRLLQGGVSGSASVERACCAGVAPTPSLSPGAPTAPEPAPSPFSSLGVLAVLEGRSAWGPVRARLLYGGEEVFLTSGLYWTHLLCWIPFRVAPFSLDAPAVLGGRLGIPVRARLLCGGLGSCFHWACLLRREPLRVFLPGRACCAGTRSEPFLSPGASAAWVCVLRLLRYVRSRGIAYDAVRCFARAVWPGVCLRVL